MASLRGDLALHAIKSPSALTDYFPPTLEHTVTTASVFSLLQQWAIPRLIDKLRGSIYHSTYYLMPYRLTIPIVFTTYDLIPIIYSKYFRLTHRIIYRIAHHLAVKVSSHIIAISQSTKSDLIRLFGADTERISVIPLAADASFQPQSRAAVETMCSHFGIPRDYCLYVGTNKPHKNLLALLRAWKYLHDSKALEGRSLVIAGQWDARYPEAKEFALLMGLKASVVFAGKVPENFLPTLYTGAELLIQPSLYEGFGLPIVEAMSCGTPVICSNSSSLTEVAGDAALFFDPRNSRNMAAILGSVIANRAKLDSMRERGFQQASRFSWDKTALDTIEVYRKMHDTSFV